MKKPIYKQWWFWVVIVVVLVIISSGMSNSETDGSSNDDNGNTQKPADNSSANYVYNVGETLTTDSLKITFQKCEQWTGYNQYFGPESGYKIIRAYFVIENISSSDKSAGSWDFKSYVNGTSMSEYAFGDNTLPYYETISSGRKIEGYIYYEVPQDAYKIEFEYDMSYWNSKKAIFKCDLSK